MYLYSDRFQWDCVTDLTWEGLFQGLTTDTRTSVSLMYGCTEKYLDPHISVRSKYYACVVTTTGALNQ